MQKNALISVSNKAGLADLSRHLTKLFGVNILSTGGTADFLKKEGISVREVSDYTGFPEMMDGRLKTLHPKVHGGILAVRSKESHLADLATHGMLMIDMVIVNLYPFEKTIESGKATFEEAVEQIDIGGPAMLRSAAKNHQSVVVIVDPNDYYKVLAEMGKHGNVGWAMRKELATKAFKHTAKYDAAIAAYLDRDKTYERVLV